MRAALSECLVQDCHMPHTMSEQSPHGAATSLMSTEAINQTIKAAGGASGEAVYSTRNRQLPAQMLILMTWCLQLVHLRYSVSTAAGDWSI